MSTLLAQPPSAHSSHHHDSFAPTTVPTRPNTLSDVAGTSMAASLYGRDSAPITGRSLNYNRRPHQERSPLATTDTANGLPTTDDTERQTTSLPQEKKTGQA